MDDSEYLKIKRFDHNLTQRDLADSLHISVQTVANWEAGRAPMPYMLRLLDWSLIERPAKPGAPKFIRSSAKRPFRHNNLGIVPRDRRNGVMWPKRNT